mgnify:CR=1 FL=1
MSAIRKAFERRGKLSWPAAGRTVARYGETRAGSVRWDGMLFAVERGGALTGPNPTDRGKPGTKYHLVVATDGLPLGAVSSAANVHDTRLLRHLLRPAQVACAVIGKL